MTDPNLFVVQAYPHLLTASEKLAQRAFVYNAKVQHSKSTDLDTLLAERRDLALADPQVLQHFRKGRHRFLSDVVKRTLHEHANEIARCEKCNAVLRTPLANQCLQCGHDCH